MKKASADVTSETETGKGQPSGNSFPADFAWGTATAAYQIEGAATADGKGESIWDRFSHTPSAIDDGTNGDVACDAYHRWPGDVDLMAQLNLNAYRFSLAWSRILPEGYGRVNGAGLDYYSRLIDALLERGIAPYVTLYHWDLPQALEEKGGWPNRDTAKAFAEFAHLAATRLGDRVGHWITHNEPHIVVYHGYLFGSKAPGLKDPTLVAPVAHHLLLSHGLAAQALRAAGAREVGITVNLTDFEPASDREEDADAARDLDGLFHRLFLDPIYRGAYPDDLEHLLSLPNGLVQAGDLETISAPLDFLGVNYYFGSRVRAARGLFGIPETLPPEGRLTTMGWEVYPQGLTNVLLRVHRDYAPKTLYVTENGAAYPDTLTPEGEVHDPERTDYLRRHLVAAREAIAAGAPLRGYFAWSLLDNFEWSYGYTQRFGVLYTDYPTQRRIVKDSGRFLAEVAATNGDNLASEG
jgi:beta-glucosidase